MHTAASIINVQHPQLGGVRMSARQIPSAPDAQVEGTVGLMLRRVAEDSRDPAFVRWAEQVAGYRTQDEQVERVWAHAKRSIQFQNDEVTGAAVAFAGGMEPEEVVEVIIRPVDMMRFVQQGCAVGDCDDYSMYVGALLAARGIDFKFATVAANGSAPDQFSHVYVVAYPVVGVEGQTRAVKMRVPVDASHGEWCGWEVGDTYGKFQEWSAGGLVWATLLMVATSALGSWLVWKYAVGGKGVV